MAKKGMIFFEEYFDYMDDMTPEQYYQFMGLIRDLRYNGIDTEVNNVEDKIVRLAWRAVRPSVLKSKINAEDYNRKKTKQSEQQTSDTIPICDLEPVPTFKTEEEVFGYIFNIDQDEGYNAAIGELEKVCERNQLDTKQIKKEYRGIRNKLFEENA